MIKGRRLVASTQSTPVALRSNVTRRPNEPGFYTSEGKRFLRYETSTRTQLADFNEASLPGSIAYGIKLLPPFDGSGGVSLADSETIVRLDGAGNASSAPKTGSHSLDRNE